VRPDIDSLPPKCREVIWLWRVDDLSQKEVTHRLGISEKSVEKHVMKGALFIPVGSGSESPRARPWSD